MERVSELVSLGSQIRDVLRVGRLLDRDLIGDRQAVALQRLDLLRVVGEDPDRAEPEVDQDLRADAEVAQVRRQPEALVRLDRVEPLLLQAVGAKFVQQTDPATLLGEVEQGALPLLLDPRQRRGKLAAAVAAFGVEHVAGQALRSGPGRARRRRRRPPP